MSIQGGSTINICGDRRGGLRTMQPHYFRAKHGVTTSFIDKVLFLSYRSKFQRECRKYIVWYNAKSGLYVSLIQVTFTAQKNSAMYLIHREALFVSFLFVSKYNAWLNDQKESKLPALFSAKKILKLIEKRVTLSSVY